MCWHLIIFKTEFNFFMKLLNFISKIVNINYIIKWHRTYKIKSISNGIGENMASVNLIKYLGLLEVKYGCKKTEKRENKKIIIFGKATAIFEHQLSSSKRLVRRKHYKRLSRQFSKTGHRILILFSLTEYQ